MTRPARLPCEHAQIVTYRSDNDHRVMVWACADCRLRFSPGRFEAAPASGLREALEPNDLQPFLAWCAEGIESPADLHDVRRRARRLHEHYQAFNRSLLDRTDYGYPYAADDAAANRVALAAPAPATLPADDTRIVWKRDHGMVIVTGDEEPQSLEIPAWAVRTIFDVAGKDPEEEARKVSAFINAHTGLDVERLARAIQMEVPPLLGKRAMTADLAREVATAIAAAYAEQGDAGER